MQFLTVRELSKSPKEALAKLSWENKVVLTNNGRPQALLFKIDESSFEKTLAMVQKLEFMQTVSEMRLSSIKSGNSNMTLDEINAEINAVRKERKKKANNA